MMMMIIWSFLAGPGLGLDRSNFGSSIAARLGIFNVPVHRQQIPRDSSQNTRCKDEDHYWISLRVQPSRSITRSVPYLVVCSVWTERNRPFTPSMPISGTSAIPHLFTSPLLTQKWPRGQGQLVDVHLLYTETLGPKHVENRSGVPEHMSGAFFTCASFGVKKEKNFQKDSFSLSLSLSRCARLLLCMRHVMINW